jgi:hypothetical protein
MWLIVTSDSSATTNRSHAKTSFIATEQLMNPSTKSAPPDQNSFVRKDVLARRYGVCGRTIEKWMKARILIFLKVKRVVRFHVQGCDEALRKRGFLTGALLPSQDS